MLGPAAVGGGSHVETDTIIHLLFGAALFPRLGGGVGSCPRGALSPGLLPRGATTGILKRGTLEE